MSEDSMQDVAETVADPEFGPWLKQASILVIDDEPGIRNFLVKILRPRCKLIDIACCSSWHVGCLFKWIGVPVERL